MVRNHSDITGPKALPTTWVPCRWIRNRHVRTAIAPGRTKCPAAGVTSSRPSMADSTEMAGVMTESP